MWISWTCPNHATFDGWSLRHEGWDYEWHIVHRCSHCSIWMFCNSFYFTSSLNDVWIWCWYVKCIWINLLNGLIECNVYCQFGVHAHKNLTCSRNQIIFPTKNSSRDKWPSRHATEARSSYRNWLPQSQNCQFWQPLHQLVFCPLRINIAPAMLDCNLCRGIRLYFQFERYIFVKRKHRHPPRIMLFQCVYFKLCFEHVCYIAAINSLNVVFNSNFDGAFCSRCPNEQSIYNKKR